MTKTELIGELARTTGLTVDGARRAIDGLFGAQADPGIIARALRSGNRIQLSGFGTFEVRTRKAYAGVHPGTRQPMAIPEASAPAFRPGLGLKAQVRGAA